MESKIIIKNTLPVIAVNGSIIDSSAYLTYFTENARYKDFAAAGFRLFSVCAYFTALPFNEESGFTGARKGIFDEHYKPCYSEFDSDVAALLDECPDALIFPRIYISMPLWWIRENPAEVIETPTTPEGRELLFSEKFRTDGAELLNEFIKHVNSMPYRENIIGYQLTGGVTQEWFHFNRNGGICPNCFPYFRSFMTDMHPEIPVTEDNFEALSESPFYREFANISVAETVEFFAKTAKNATEARLIIGVFYGYSLEVANPLWGTHALTRLLDSPSIDFFASPLSYGEGRLPGRDWVTMLPEDSVRLHGKIYFAEADVRTCLSRYPDECRKNLRLRVPYRHPIWLGPASEKLSVYNLRKAFGKILTKSRAFWWFDMWGGWYASPAIMSELSFQKRLTACFDDYNPLPERLKACVIVDENYYSDHPGSSAQHVFCREIASLGISFDLFLSCDLPYVKEKYGITLFASEPLDEALPQRLADSPVFVFCESGDIISCGNGFITLHAATGGEKQLALPGNSHYNVLTDHRVTEHNGVLHFVIEQYDTIIMRFDYEN